MEMILVKTERALSLTQIKLADYVINPYKGCLVGCTYCYARSNRGIRKIDREWGEYVYIKEGFLARLEEQIRRAGKIGRVLIGSTTEAFQPVPEKNRITGDILCLIKKLNIPFVLLTKSAAVASHIPLMGYSAENKVYLTYNSPVIRELFEKRSSSPEERLKAIDELHQNSIDTIVYVSPVFPGLTDVPRILEELDGKCSRISFESYSKKLGNWEDIRKKLPLQTLEQMERVYSSREAYDSYWQDFQDRVNELNSSYGFILDFFIYPFNAYYGPG